MNVLLLFSVTGFFLWFCGEGILDLFYPVTPYVSFLGALSVFTGLWILLFCAQSWRGIRILKFIKGARPLLDRERSRLEGLITSVQYEIYLKTGLQPLKVDIFFEENPLPTVYAVGRKTLFMSRTLYEMTTDKELKGLIAAELGSLQSGAAQRRFCAVVLRLIPFYVAWLLKESGKFLYQLSFHLSPKKKELFPLVFVPITILCMGFFLIIGCCLTKGALGILYVLSWAPYQRQIFKADIFAEEVGFGEGLLSFLQKIKNFDFDQSPHFLDHFYDPTPKIMVRIGRLEKALKAPQNFPS